MMKWNQKFGMVLKMDPMWNREISFSGNDGFNVKKRNIFEQECFVEMWGGKWMY